MSPVSLLSRPARRTLVRAAAVTLAAATGTSVTDAFTGGEPVLAATLLSLGIGLLAALSVTVADRVLLSVDRYGRAWSATSAAYGFLLTALAFVAFVVALFPTRRPLGLLLAVTLVLFLPAGLLVTLAGAAVPHRG